MRQSCSLQCIHHHLWALTLCECAEICALRSIHAHARSAHLVVCGREKVSAAQPSQKIPNEEREPLLFLDLRRLWFLSLVYELICNLHLSYMIQTLTNAQEMYVLYSCMCCMFMLFYFLPYFKTCIGTKTELSIFHAIWF